jgi:hypothetical protein
VTKFKSCSEFGVYETRYRQDNNGLPFCQILSRDQQVNPIQVIGSANQVYTFSSQGYLNGIKYVCINVTVDLFWVPRACRRHFDILRVLTGVHNAKAEECTAPRIGSRNIEIA